MKILAFAGSNSSTSINRQLVQYTCSYFSQHTVSLLKLDDYEMPLYGIDKEKQSGIPEAAHRFREQIGQHDALIIALAEHNRSYTVAFKNIFDWCSRISTDVFAKKPMLLLSTSPGGYGGGNVMQEALKFFPQFGAEIIAHFSLPLFQKNFDPVNKQITDPELKTALETEIKRFQSHLEQLTQP